MFDIFVYNYTTTSAYADNLNTLCLVTEPQVDVTATVIHTLLDILDDRLYAIYKRQFTKLIRILILNYLPQIKNITPPAKSGSVSRLQIYLEKKYTN